MIVGIDVTQVVYETGTSTYTKNLVTQLLKLDKSIAYKLFGGTLRRTKDLDSFFGSLSGKFEAKVVPLSPQMAHFLWNKLHKFQIEKIIGKIDIFHSSDWTQPPSQSLKITTVHDLSPILFPDLTHPRIVAAHKQRLDWVRKEVDMVIVPSEATKNDILNYGVSTERVQVIPEAADPFYRPAQESTIVLTKNRLGIQKEYLLGVGVNARKNISRTLEAFSQIRKKTPDLQMVIVGNQARNGFHDTKGVIFTGHIPKKELAALYSGAQALVYPSLYEGFGLPILEAFACGCPVVTSNVSSLPEVSGGAAILVDPDSVSSIKEGILRMLEQRNSYIKKGYLRLARFSWVEVAEKTLKVYKSLLVKH